MPTAEVAVLLLGLAAATLALGTAALLSHALRRALVIGLLGVLLGIPGPRRSPWYWLSCLLGAAWLLMQSPPVFQAAAAVWVLAHRCSDRDEPSQTVVAALAAFVVYRLAVGSIGWLWLAVNSLALAAGALAGTLSGHALHPGPVLAGLDALILSLLVCGALIWVHGRPRARVAAWALGAVLVGHLVYLLGLSLVPVALEALRAGAGPETPLTGWRAWLSAALPWHAPLLALAWQLLVIGTLLRWSRWDPATAAARGVYPWPRRLRPLLVIAALGLPVATHLYPARAHLAGKTIVFYEKGFLNWLKPEHGSYGRLSSGMYGMLPRFVESLGARTRISPDLSAADLADADAVVLLFPDDPWLAGQRERLWDFVRGGGRLLVMGEHTTEDPNGSNRFNEILEPTSLRVAFDSATFVVGGWLQSYEALAHPATIGIDDRRNDFGVVIGASLDIGWPARPLLLGRWGWSDGGDLGAGPSLMGNHRIDPGERIGDLVLAAEQPLGRGRIVVFGDTSGLTNAINVGTHVFNARLFAYLAGAGQAGGGLRQVAALALALMLGGGLLAVADGRRAAVALLLLSLSLSLCQRITSAAQTLLPAGRDTGPLRLAYIDESHVPAHSGESWRPRGLGGLALTLMRDDYLTLTLPAVTNARLERADLLVVVAPARAYRPGERARIRTFVETGGTLLVTAGADHVTPVRPLLADFDFHVAAVRPDRPEPRALGHFKSPYLRSDAGRVFVRFHAAWWLTSTAADAEVLAYGADNLPVIMLRRVGRGKVIVVADTDFATTQNLEYEDGRPFEGLRENAEFWRWLLSVIRDEPMWIPPSLRDPNTPEAPTP